MSHIPINHPLRPLYRTLSVLTGLFILVFGIVGAVNTSGDPVFDQDKIERVFGLRTNFAFSVLSIAAGAVLVLATVIGRNLDKWVYLLGGIVFMAVGLAELALMDTDLNYFAFAMTNVIVSMVIGSILFTAGLYGKSGRSEEAHAEESFRHEHAVA
jgi:4-hydroxybenzoate polyprenyltransferase